MKLAIEFENPAPTWWESGGRELWEAIAESPDAGSVLVDEAIAESWIAEAAKVPGWDGGPEYAPHPVYVKAVNEDDID